MPGPSLFLLPFSARSKLCGKYFKKLQLSASSQPRFSWALRTKQLKAYGSFIAVHDSAAIQVVGTQFHRYAVAGKNADKVLAHASRDMGQHLVIVLEFDLEHGVRKRFHHHRHYLNRVFLRQAVSRFWRRTRAALFMDREVTRSEFLHRCPSPQPCAQNERSHFRLWPPPSSRRPIPSRRACQR